MAEEVDKEQKTEEATPKRRQEARDKGQVALSTELTSAIMLIGALLLVLSLGGRLANSASALLVESVAGLGFLGVQELSVADAASLVGDSASEVLGSFTLMIAPLILIGLLVGYGQVGFKIAPKAVSLDLNKLNPVKGLSRVFSMRGTVRTTLAFAKILVVAGVTAFIAWTQVPQMAALSGVDLRGALVGLGIVLFRCSAGALGAVLALSLFDLAFQRFQHRKDLRMSKKELRDEHKTMEGDPHIKARVRQIQRDLASRRMMADVPKSTVVVTNPTHYAVALRYEPEASEHGNAPVVTAKGVDSVAQRIKEVAREAGVICFENVPLARGLHASAEIGDEVPEQFYEAVASVLAYVYRLQGHSVSA